MRAGDHERGRPAVHPLHLGLDREAQGRGPHDRRLRGLGCDDLRLDFDYRPDDIFWCTADIGWITGHSYVVYGPLTMGATSVMFDGVPNYPDFGRFWETVDRLGVTIFYTAPTAIRALMREGDEPVKRYAASRSACSARSASRSIPRPGNGTGASSATAAARSSTPGGRPRPAAA